MQTFEKQSREKFRNAKIQRAILKTVAVAGLLSLAILAPNALRIIKLFGSEPGKRTVGTITRTRKRLIEKGLLQYRDGYLKLTEKGESELRKFELQDFKFRKPKQWDKKWRVLIFDIPEKRRNTRNKIRTTLRAIGFIKLQDSVWIYPYECEDLITLLKADFHVGKDMLYLIVDSVENDLSIKEYFNVF